ncbi:MAG: ATP-binding protein [Salinisphaera sp.]|nr:ATP-binding protein [Salinisphaera sp.]
MPGLKLVRPPIRLNSLAARLLGSAGIVLLAFVALTGVALEQAVRERSLQAERDKLQGLAYAILGNAEVGAHGDFQLPARGLPEDALSRPASGLYALVANGEGAVVWHSPSLIEPVALPRQLPAIGEWRFISPADSEDAYLKLVFGIRWVTPGGQSYRYTLMVAESAAPFVAQIRRFRGVLWLWLGLSAGVLLALQMAILRWGLAPLRRLARGVRQIQSGASARIEGRYPAELQGLVTSLNALLESEKSRLERYRNALADLAHALKTPVAVLRGMSAERSLPAAPQRQLQSQLARINEIVDYQLTRAATAGTRTLVPPIAVAPVCVRLCAALRKVYAEARTEFEQAVPAGIQAAVDEGDLTEILGNLLDNAAKYGGGRVRIEARQTVDGVDIQVDDNGPGFPKSGAAVLLQRGVRADSRGEGQGIGLAVSAEIVAAYAGEIHLERAATLGGARVRLSFAANRSG